MIAHAPSARAMRCARPSTVTTWRRADGYGLGIHQRSSIGHGPDQCRTSIRLPRAASTNGDADSNLRPVTTTARLHSSSTSIGIGSARTCGRRAGSTPGHGAVSDSGSSDRPVSRPWRPVPAGAASRGDGRLRVQERERHQRRVGPATGRQPASPAGRPRSHRPRTQAGDPWRR